MLRRSWIGCAAAALMLVVMPCSAGALEFVQPAGSPYPTTDPSFGPQSFGFLGGEAVGDFNGDGISDLAVVDETGLPLFSPGESVSILLGSRSGALTLAPGSPVALFSGGEFAPGGPIVTGDFTGNGKLDLAVIDEHAGTVSILLGNGAGEFKLAGPPIPYSGGEQPSLVVGDFNGDGTLDLAIAAGTELNILLGDGSGGFAPAPGSPVALPGLVSSLAAGDFNGDHRTDLAAAIYSGEVAVYLNNGEGRFTPAEGPPPTTDGAPRAIAVGRFTRTGPLDLATANPGTDTVTVLLGNGEGGFQPASGSPFPVAGGPGASPSMPGDPDSIAVGDFNHDGNTDIAAANFNGSSDNVAILQGDGSGGFTNADGSPFPANGNPRPIAVGDFHGDGCSDIAVVNTFLSSVTMLLDTSVGGSPEPAASSCAEQSAIEPTGPAAEPNTRARGRKGGAPEIESLRATSYPLHARRGVTLEVNLSRAGAVVIQLERSVRVHGRRLLRPAGSLTLLGRAGANRFNITRVDGHTLRPGNYIVWAFAKLGARRSAGRSLTIDVRR
jgi:FG-GAP-like repeat